MFFFYKPVKFPNNLLLKTFLKNHNLIDHSIDIDNYFLISKSQIVIMPVCNRCAKLTLADSVGNRDNDMSVLTAQDTQSCLISVEALHTYNTAITKLYNTTSLSAYRQPLARY